MIMVTNIRAHNICEKLLTYIKASKLNYLVHETPYSVFITIRKRVIKECQELSGVTPVHEDSENIEEYQKKNNI